MEKIQNNLHHFLTLKLISKIKKKKFHFCKYSKNSSELAPPPCLSRLKHPKRVVSVCAASVWRGVPEWRRERVCDENEIESWFAFEKSWGAVLSRRLGKWSGQKYLDDKGGGDAGERERTIQSAGGEGGVDGPRGVEDRGERDERNSTA